MKRKLTDLMITHSIIFQRKSTVRKHKLRVIFLSSFNSPWRINNQNIKFSNFLCEQIPIEIFDITVDIRVANILAVKFELPGFIN